MNDGPLEDMELDGLADAMAPVLITEVPGPEAQLVLERDRRTTSPSLPRAYPFVPARGSGSVVEDVDGTNSYGKPYSVRKSGAGLLTLNGANSFPGTFNFLGGLVRFSNPGNPRPWISTTRESPRFVVPFIPR